MRKKNQKQVNIQESIIRLHMYGWYSNKTYFVHMTTHSGSDEGLPSFAGVIWQFNRLRSLSPLRYWKTKNLSPKRLSTGILMYTLASAVCDEIHLYGFWPFGWDPNTGKDLPYHYYDKKGTKFTTKWQETHQLPTEFKLLYKLHREGVIKLSLTHCS